MRKVIFFIFFKFFKLFFNSADKFEALFEQDDDFTKSSAFSSSLTAFDAFGKNDFNTTTNNNNNNVSNNNGNDFDPFGLSVTDLKKTKTSGGFGFDGDFANFDAFNNNNGSGNAFESSNGNDTWGTSKSTTSISSSNSKIKKYKDSDAKVNKITKFNADYSDNYEKDLNDVLKRSMVDQ